MGQRYEQGMLTGKSKQLTVGKRNGTIASMIEQRFWRPI